MPFFFSEIRKRSYAETAQFQENFEVYIQALISQCLDGNFLDEVFNDADEYFVSNIEKVDSVTLLRKDKVMNGVGWTLRFQQALNTWPCLSDLGSAAVTVKLKKSIIKSIFALDSYNSRMPNVVVAIKKKLRQWCKCSASLIT